MISALQKQPKPNQNKNIKLTKKKKKVNKTNKTTETLFAEARYGCVSHVIIIFHLPSSIAEAYL